MSQATTQDSSAEQGDTWTPTALTSGPGPAARGTRDATNRTKFDISLVAESKPSRPISGDHLDTTIFNSFHRAQLHTDPTPQ